MSIFNTAMNIILIVLSVVAIVFLFFKSRQHTRKQEEINSRFLEEEEAANSVRKKEIDAELFFTPDLSALPPIPDSDPHQIKRCATRTMIRFDVHMTNLELKKLYGPAQMDIIAQYEENFSEYLKALTKWAVALSDENFDGNQVDVMTILEKVITMGGEYRDAYKLAADICEARNDKSGLENLLELVMENHFKDPSIRQQILDYINRKNLNPIQ
jgi:hypothetical protein